MHVTINPNGHVFINIVSLRFEFEVWCKVVTAIYLRNTLENIPVEKFKSFAIDRDFISAELGAKCR